MLFNNSICSFQVLITRSKSLSPLWELKVLVDADNLLKAEESVDNVALDRSEHIDDTRPYVNYLIFDRLHSLVINYNLYCEDDE